MSSTPNLVIGGEVRGGPREGNGWGRAPASVDVPLPEVESHEMLNAR